MAATTAQSLHTLSVPNIHIERVHIKMLGVLVANEGTILIITAQVLTQTYKHMYFTLDSEVKLIKCSSWSWGILVCVSVTNISLESYRNHRNFNGSEKKNKKIARKLSPLTEEQSELLTWERSSYGPITESFRKGKTSHTHIQTHALSTYTL